MWRPQKSHFEQSMSVCVCVCLQVVIGTQSNTCCSHKHKSPCCVYRDCPAAAAAAHSGVTRMLSLRCVDRKSRKQPVHIHLNWLTGMSIHLHHLFIYCVVFFCSFRSELLLFCFYKRQNRGKKAPLWGKEGQSQQAQSWHNHTVSCLISYSSSSLTEPGTVQHYHLKAASFTKGSVPRGDSRTSKRWQSSHQRPPSLNWITVQRCVRTDVTSVIYWC